MQAVEDRVSRRRRRPGGGVLIIMLLLQLILLIWTSSFSSQQHVQGAVVGFNYGMQMSGVGVGMAEQVVKLVKVQHIPSLRLYDPNPAALSALSGSGVTVAVSVPNTQLLSVGQSNASAANWVKNNVAAYLPNTNITTIIVGDEVFTSLPNAALVLLPAMKYLYSALSSFNLQNQVKITTTLSTSLILDSFPPSQAFFNHSITTSLLQPMLAFLATTGSFAMFNIYPYDVYKSGAGIITLDYALFKPLASGAEIVDSNTLLAYTNLFDAILDSAYFALAKLNLSSLPIAVAETGWPYKGDTDANPDNAATYNSNLIRHIVDDSGTPKHPRSPINTYILDLFDQDLKPGPATTKHYGLFNASTMLPNYLLRLTGSGQLLANDTTNQLYCVAKPGVDNDVLQVALDWVCGTGRANCSAIQPGKLCYEPDTVPNHASYAFDSYYQANGRSDTSCTFSGVAVITTTNPSYGACLYPGSMTNFSSLSASSNETLASNGTMIDGNNTSSGNGNGNDTRTSGAPPGLFFSSFFQTTTIAAHLFAALLLALPSLL